MPNEDLDFFLQLEQAVWRALCEGDMQADAALIADDFLGVYPSGLAEKSAHVSQLGGGAVISAFALSDAKSMTLAEGVVLLTYRAEFARHGEERPKEAMFVSSIWRREGVKWQNVFSQDTPAAR